MYRKVLLVVTLAVAFAAAEVHAQSVDASQLASVYLAEELTHVPNRVVYDSPVRRLWVSAGGGIGTLDGGKAEDIALAGQISGHWQHGHRVLSLRAATVTYVCIDKKDADCGQQDVGLLIGWGTTGSTGHASVGVGIAAVPSEDEFFHTVGLPLQFQFLFDVGGSVGLGLYGFANINSKQSFGGVTLSLSIGGLQ